LPHNIPYIVRPYTFSPCTALIQHGNVFAAAYTKIMVHNTGCKLIDVTVVASQNGDLVSSTRRIINPVPGTWYQATKNWSSIVGSRWIIRNEDQRFAFYSYRGV